MRSSASSGPQQVPLSRRQFLCRGARAATGLTLAPALLVPAGCGMQGVATTAAGPAKHVLRARRVRGAPDGRERELCGYDGQVPGPDLRARAGETLRVKVTNELGVPTSVHWHGLHQPGTWHMDGVAGVSQAPIPAGAEFVYEYKATPAGTHWYHAHVGVQYGNGLFGPLVVDDPAPIAAYDREETRLINDWFWQPGEEELARLLKGGPGKMPGMDKMPMKDTKAGPDLGDVPFQSGLINGKGRAGPDCKGPLTEVRVEKGETVRLRLINGSSTYALRFQVDGHALTVIASDGQPMKPVPVDNLVMDVGETYDALPKADQEGGHWARAVTLAGNPILAVLRYAGAARRAGEKCGQVGAAFLAAGGHALPRASHPGRPAARGPPDTGRLHDAVPLEHQRAVLSQGRPH